MEKPKIVTDLIWPPIPSRAFDWAAFRDGYEPDEPIGYGETEREAIKALLEIEAENEN